MKWRILIITVFLTPALLSAQPTLIRSWIAQVGSGFVTQPVVDNVGPGDAGADVEWDFSTATPDTIMTALRFVPADTTAYAAMYPEANVCAYQEEFGIYNYFYIDDNIMEELGIAFTQQQRVYSDPKTFLEFPFTYGSSFTDDYSSSRAIAGFTYYSRGSIEAEGDAYGTLHLPGETFPNVLRVKSVDLERDSADLGSGYIEVFLREQETYTWYSESHPGPIAIFNMSTQTQIGILMTPDTTIADTMNFDPQSQFSFDPTAVYSGTHTFEDDAFGLEIKPNPFSTTLTMTFTAEAPQNFLFELRSVSGESVFQQDIQGVQGVNTVQITPGVLPAGSYVAIMRGEKRATTRKVVRWE